MFNRLGFHEHGKETILENVRAIISNAWAFAVCCDAVVLLL